MAMNSVERRQRDAVLDMATDLANSWDALGHLTCSETYTIVRVVALFGFEELAAEIVVCHASTDDDENDVHHDVHAASGDQMDLARKHVARVVAQ